MGRRVVQQLLLTLVQPRLWREDGDANFDEVLRLLSGPPRQGGPTRIVVLPELIGSTLDRERYVERVLDLAVRSGAWVVGGSHHWHRPAGVRNAGIAATPSGSIVAEYEKRNPYGAEVGLGVAPGTGPAAFEVEGRSVAVLICADFWHSECIQDLPAPPDLMVVPSFSITRGKDPATARALWRHLAVSRAYEHGAHVGLSDWSPAASWGGLHASGLAASISPVPERQGRFISSLADRRSRSHLIDFARLEALRQSQHERGMFSTRAGRRPAAITQ